MASVLVVDDDPSGRELLTTLLRYKGHETLEAADGAEALDIVRASRPQLVVSDILMPTMDGYEFVRRLRADAGLGNVQVIFYTASYHEKEALKLAESGRVAKVLVKPCEPANLLQAVEDVLTGAAREDAKAVPREFNTEHLRLLTDKLWQRTTELEAANARLAALTDLHVQLASERDPKSLLEHVCHGARRLFGARYSVLAARGKNGNGQSFFAVSGLDVSARQPERPSLQAGALGRVMTARKAWRISRDDGATIDAGLPSGYPRASSFLAVPLTSLTQAYGWICLADKVGADGFSEDDERLLGTLGAQVGRIYENGSLYQELQRRARELQNEIAERERATAGLRTSEERFRQLAENIRDAFFVASRDLNELIYVSPAYVRIWGREAAPGARCDEVLTAGIDPRDAARARTEFERIARGAEAGRAQFRIRHRDGSTRWVLVRTFQVHDPDTDGGRIVGTAKDVTESQLATQRIEQLNRVYAVLSSINTLIVRVTDREELFRESCRLAVEFGRFAAAWIGWLDPDRGVLSPVAWAGREADLLATARIKLAEDPEAEGLAATAMRTRKPQYSNNLVADRRPILFRDEMVKRGYHSLIALPLVVDDAAAGCLAMIAEEPDFFNEDEIRLLEELASDISFALDHIEKSDRLYYLAYYDSLTGLANRTLFLDRLTQHLVLAERGRRKLALIAMAPERLGSINDSFGRPAGDLVLKQFAQRFTAAVGPGNEPARVAGDQLVGFVDDVTEEVEVVRTISRWQEICFGQPFDIHGTQMRLGAISGVAMFPEDGADAATLLRNAEAALERAKTTGDSQLFYTQRMSVAVTEKLMLEHALREAQDLKEFQLHYQPRVDLESRRIRGLEALIRWRSPTRGIVSPAVFIPLMEETGMIVPVGAWVLRQAAEERDRWSQMGLNPPRVAVNVSTVQLRRRDFVETVRQALKGSGKTSGIDIEVTESLIMEDVDSNIRKLEEIRRMEIGIALDDFGTGYSSLGYLAKLPVGTLKIDRSFIARMLDDPGAMTLVSTMISLAHSLKLTVVAEGVETEEQAKILRLLRCDQIQGYLICKPLPFDEMTAFLGNWKPS